MGTFPRLCDVLCGGKFFQRLGGSTPFSPPSGLATGSFNGLHTKSKFLAIKILYPLLLDFSALAFTACIHNETTIIVNPDGSGTIVEEFLYTAETLKLSAEADEHFSSGEEPDDPARKLLLEEKAKKRAQAYGAGVSLVKIEPVDNNGARGARITYAFNDISKLSVIMNENLPDWDVNVVNPPLIRFEFKNGELTVHMPQPDRNAAVKEKSAYRGEVINTDKLKQFSRDMKKVIKIKVASGIAASDATHHNDLTCTLLEINGGKISEKEDNLQKLRAALEHEENEYQQKNFPRLLESLKGIDGIRFEEKPSTKIKLK